jgi:hypothetical protein
VVDLSDDVTGIGSLLVESAKPKQKSPNHGHGNEHQRKNSADAPPIGREGLGVAQQHETVGADTETMEAQAN